MLLNASGCLDALTAPDVARSLDEHVTQLAASVSAGAESTERNRKFVTAFARPRGLGVSATAENQDGRHFAVQAVYNSGVGIPPREVDRVLDTYFRGTNVSGSKRCAMRRSAWLVPVSRAEDGPPRRRHCSRLERSPLHGQRQQEGARGGGSSGRTPTATR